MRNNNRDRQFELFVNVDSLDRLITAAEAARAAVAHLLMQGVAHPETADPDAVYENPADSTVRTWEDRDAFVCRFPAQPDSRGLGEDLAA